MATQEKRRHAPAHSGNGGESREMSKTQSPHRTPATHFGGDGPFRQMREEFDRLFDRFFPAWSGTGPGQIPSRSDFWGLDVDERDDAIVVRAEAPGFEPGDFDLQVRGNQLVLCACHQEESAEKERPFQWSRQELSRSVTLPADVNADKVEANYRNGVLVVTMPKSKPSASRTITVKA